MSLWTQIDAGSRTLLEYLVERSLIGALVFVLVLAAWLVVRRFVSVHFASAWFLLPLVTLLVPVERLLPAVELDWTAVESALAIPRTEMPQRDPVSEPRNESVAAAAHLAAPIPSHQTVRLAGESARLPAASFLHPAPPPTLSEEVTEFAIRYGPFAIVLVWALLVLRYAARFFRAQREVLAMTQRARDLSEETIPALGMTWSALARRAGLRLRPDALRVRETNELDSPATWGLGRPVLLLPEGLVQKLSASELRWVLLHEFAHLARRDHWIELFQQIVQVAFFFHPAAWFSNRILREQREIACDEAALARCTPVEREGCATALLEVAAHASGLVDTRLSAARHVTVPLLSSRKLLRGRIMRLNHIAQRRVSWGLSPLAVLPLAICGLAVLAPARMLAPTVAKRIALPNSQVVRVDPAQDPTDNELRASVPQRQSEENVCMAIERGIAWLLAHQEADGGWHNHQHELRGVPQLKPYFNDYAVTGLAMRTMLNWGNHTELAPREKRIRAIERAVEFLINSQEESGCYGKPVGYVFLVGHAMATEAMAEAICCTHWPATTRNRWRESLTKAVAFIERSRNPYSGWRYDTPPTGDNDALQTGRMLLALTAALDAGVHAAPATFAGGLNYMAEQREKDTGRTLYSQGNPFALRVVGRQDDFPAKLAEAPTAVHIALQMNLDEFDIQIVHDGQGVLLDRLPVWSRALGMTDFNYWMYGTRAMAATGGLAARCWNDALVEALLSHQVRSGDESGSWPCSDAWSAPGMEAYATASNTLSLIFTQN